MNKEEMLKGLLDDDKVREAIMVMSKHGNLEGHTVVEAIPDYYRVCSAMCSRLLEMEVHKKCPLGPENANVPFLILGQPGVIQGAVDDMACYFLSVLKEQDEDIIIFAKRNIAAGEKGEPNLFHGMMNTNGVGYYLEQMKLAQIMASLDFSQPKVNLDEVPDIFAETLH